MIVVKLLGGLGNQMFQYAIGRVLSLKLNTDLKFDHDFFQGKDDEISTKRSFELHVFNIDFKKATDYDIKLFTGKSRLQKKIEHEVPFFKKYHLVIEKSHEFNATILDTKNNSYLNGYWQSEKYFKSIRSILLKDFILKNPINTVNALNVLKCQNKNSVSIHIRRGDYVSNSSNLLYHGICSLQYYYDAIHYLKGKINEDIKLFVFTDDMVWVNENFKPEYNFEIINDNKGIDSFYDMYLMSICHHNIIANSSFSWWGAWLNTHPNKIVIAPKNWFETKDINSEDVIPENWVKL